MNHISEELFERYSMQQLSEEQMAPLEEHLLVCSLCQQRLNEVDEYIGAMKIAAQEISDKKTSVRELHAVPRRPLQWALPLTGGTLVTALLLFLYIGRSPGAPPSEIALTATRGVSPNTAIKARAHTALKITAEAQDIAPGSRLRLELADSDGKIVWRGAGEIERGHIAAQVKPPLDAGLYWFRVYQNDRLQQEYGLQVE